MSQPLSARWLIIVGAFYLLFIVGDAMPSTPHPAADQMLAAARWWVDACRTIRQVKQEQGLINTEADSSGTGLIGVEYTPITTTLGSLRAKQISENPDFAALIVRWLWTMGVRKGDKVAVSLTGSFPGLNLSVLAAIHALRLNAVIISSLGSSSWGANQPEMTWADIEKVLLDKGMISEGSDAMTMGGGGDWGGGLSLDGKEILFDKIRKSKAKFLDAKSLVQAIGMKLKLYGNLDQYKCFINVGGGQSALGRGPGGRSLPTGLLKRFPEDGPYESGEVDGLVFYFLRQQIPVIHLLEIHRIAKEWGISTSWKPYIEPGKSLVYFADN